ncbi:MAG TPA: uroporphyrinogen-III synthase [Burkholderiales bacterium]|nr:uroporphyrinogen-III synthase [Burkholderiales bacterium]
MRGRTVVVLENRAGSQMSEVLERRGAHAIWIPVLAEVPDMDEHAVTALLASHRERPFALVVLQTGVGTRALFEASARVGLEGELRTLLAEAKVAARGPKPAAVLRSHQVRIDYLAGDPYTTEALIATLPLQDFAGRRVLVQRHGESNQTLLDAIGKQRAHPEELPVYRWIRREENVEALLETLREQRVDAVVFTSMAQVHALFEGTSVQRDALLEALNRTLVCSIGPVCSAALREASVRVGLEPSPPKLGALFAAMETALEV